MDRTFGPAFCEVLDGDRLRGQIAMIYRLMKDGQWRTLDEIALETGAPQASISSDLRHLRKPKFGAYQVEKRRRTKATFEYRVLLPLPSGQLSLLGVIGG